MAHDNIMVFMKISSLRHVNSPYSHHLVFPGHCIPAKFSSHSCSAYDSGYLVSSKQFHSDPVWCEIE